MRSAKHFQNPNLHSRPLAHIRPAEDQDPGRRRVHVEAALWLDPDNHRTRRNEPWSARHTENMCREWTMRISPEIPRLAKIVHLRDRLLWVRILNRAPDRGAMSPDSVQKTGQACRSFISWLQHRGLLDMNPMAGVPYIVAPAQTKGLDPLAVTADEVASMQQVLALSEAMAAGASPNRPGRGGNRTDVVGVQGRRLQPLFTATSGLRNGELFALRVDDIDVAGLQIRVRETLVQPDTGQLYLDVPKNGRQRITVFAGVLAHDLADYITYRRAISDQSNPLAFPGAMGGWERRRGHTMRFRRAAVAAGWPPHLEWRGLRHLAAVTMMQPAPLGMGLTLEETSRLLGHHSPEFTARRYLTVRNGWIERAQTGAALMRLS